MKWEFSRRAFLGQTAMAGVGICAGAAPASLEEAFLNPPDESKVWAYWWWLDGAASKEGITVDLEAMKRQGISGVLLFDAGEGGPEAPKGPAFMSDAWRENFRHAVREAARLGIEMGVNLCSGWDAAGPWVRPEDAMKRIVWTETMVEGPQDVDLQLPRPDTKSKSYQGDWYRDIAVLACRDSYGWKSGESLNLTSDAPEGHLKWGAPEGAWTVLRMGYTLGGQKTKNVSLPEAAGFEIDPLSAEAMERHFAETGAKLIADAGPLAGTTLKYTHIDSWEIGQPEWTGKFTQEFRKRRGYDPLPYLPALAKKTVDSMEITERFLWDYRRTLADLTAANYYGRLSALSLEHGLGTHSESAGPMFTQAIDALECEGINDIPMAEFWISATQNRFLPVATPTAGMSRVLHPARTVASVRQAASAAHVYGKRLTQAEAFTTFNDDWIEYPYALKVPGDEAFCLGLTRNVLCFYVHQPRLDIQPGYQWAHIGTHFDRNITWWSQSHAWLGYLARCQHMLRQGRFVADVLYFSGEVVPNFVPFDAKPVAGHDFDVINAQALLGRASSKDGRMVLADGTSYRYLVLPAQVTDKMTAPVVEKIRALVEGGATVIGGRPRQTPGLGGYPECDRKLKTVADSIWGAADASSGERMAGEGRVIWGKTVEEVIAADGLRPDIEFRHAASGVKFQWIHRRDGETEIYFVSNAGDAATDVEVEFRVAGKTPELWDAVTGRVRALPEFRMQGGSTAVPMRFEPRQSFFVVFRRSVGSEPAARGRNFPRARKVDEISGPWQVSFNPKWGPARPVVFEQLVDWTRRPEEDIRYYSGAAVYRRSFDAPVQGGERLYLDLGRVHNLARVRLNGRDLGVVWTAPWRVDITDAVKQKENQLEIEVVNLWPNRLIGDGKLPKKRRRTVTNVRTYDAVLPPGFKRYGCLKCERRMKTREAAQLLPSGLLGPVTLCALPEFPRTPSTTTGWRP